MPFVKYIILPIVAVSLLFSPFYGCRTEDNRENPTQNPKVTNSATEYAGFSEKSEPDTNEIAQLLQGATEEFAQVFQDGSQKKSNENHKLDVSPDIKAKYAITVRPELLPKLEEKTKTNDVNAQKYHLQYKFQQGETIQWQVLHKIRKKLTFAGKTQGIETVSRTRRRWNILEKTDEGKFRCEHLIEEMILVQNEEGKDPISYDSRKDEKVPREFAIFGTDKTVRTVLERFNIDATGLMSAKKKLVPEFSGLESDSKVLVPFPLEPVAVGESWTIPYLIFLKGRDEAIRSYQAVQKFTLDRVEGDLAVIRFRTILLSVVTDPIIEGQLAEKLYTGRSVFDMKQGRTLETELDFSKSVANAMGDTSHLEYYCHLTEKLMRPGDVADSGARRPKP